MNWEPFHVAPTGSKPEAPRPLDTFEGIGDRLRVAAFAELQAREAFLWAAENFGDAPDSLKRAWTALAQAEQRHLDWLLNRMSELKIEIQERRVSDQLWHSLISCKTTREFALYMASAEERGRVAGVRFHQALSATDPITAEIFGKIAEEEVAHIALAEKYFPAHRLQ
jgi:uncharacterized ferritin-like protein (DUF455 family)